MNTINIKGQEFPAIEARKLESGLIYWDGSEFGFTGERSHNTRNTMSLIDYLQDNAIQCAPKEADADVIFFGVRKGPGATAEALKAAMATHKGKFCDVNPLDGNEHSYIELGGWVGDQGAALKLIGLGAALGVWKLLTPKTMLGDLCPPDMVQQMAGMGMVSMQAA